MKNIVKAVKDMCLPVSWLSALYWFISASFMAGGILAAVQGNWSSVALAIAGLALFFLPFLLKVQLKIYIPTIFCLFISLFLYATLILGEVEQYYQKFWWWDVVLHAGSGIAFGILGLIVIMIFFRLGKITAPSLMVCLFAFCFALTVGVLWEIYEFAGDQLFGTNMQQLQTGVVDTMKDFCMDALGGLIGAIIGYFYLSPNASTPLDGIIHRAVIRNRKK